MQLSLLALSLSAAAGVLAQQGGFLQTCESIKLRGRYLTATCNSITGGNQRCSRLDLNKCLKNQFGQLVADSLGMGYLLLSLLFSCLFSFSFFFFVLPSSLNRRQKKIADER